MEPEKDKNIWSKKPRKNHIEVTADKLVKTHEKLEKLKDKKINPSFLDLF